MSSRVTRRRFLKAAGVAMALPLFESAAPRVRAGTGAALPRRRIVAICYPIGLHAPNFFPTETGRNYGLSRYLKVLEDYRDDFTVFSGLSHPRIARTHTADITFLTGAACERSEDFHKGTFRNSISLDQMAAALIGSETRFPALTLGPTSLSFTPTGVKLPGYNSPSQAFAKLFLAGGAAQVQSQIRKVRDGQSILDVVRAESRAMQHGLPAGDRARLEEYFNSVRELEERMVKGLEWEKAPKPKVSAQPPKDVSPNADPFGHLSLMFDIIHLALQTDSTRLVALHGGLFAAQPVLDQMTLEYHNLSHHGKDPQKIEKVGLIETELMKVFKKLLAKLKDSKEEGETLLDRTMVLLGSNLGNANSHETTNLPILLAGGGFKHGQHLAFNQDNNTPLCNLYLTMLQRLGLEVSSFGSSKGTIKGLE